MSESTPKDFPGDPRWSGLLAPIADGAPTGADIRGGAAYIEIREAQREDDEGDMGVWQRTRKLADWPLVSRLCTKELTHSAKDLQLAAWWLLAELKMRGFAGFHQGARLIEELIGRYWEGLYPPIEDGDTGLRVVPLEWIAGRLGTELRQVPITKSGQSWYRYQESTLVPAEGDTDDDAKRRQRQEAINDGKLTPEEFLEGLRATPASFWEEARSELGGALETLKRIEAVCEPLCPEEPPSFGALRETIEELTHTLQALPARKSPSAPAAAPPVAARPPAPAGDPFAAFDQAAAEPEPEPEPEPVPGPAEDPFAAFADPEPVASEPAEEPARAPRAKRQKTAPAAEQPEDELAAAMAARAARLREADPSNPAPYLLVRGLRWGELRAARPPLNPAVLEAPPLELRRALRQLRAAGDWRELLEAAEQAAALACGRAWLDLHAYTLEACRELGEQYAAIHDAVASELARLVADLPALAGAVLDDETPCASAGTLAMIRDLVQPGRARARFDQPTPLYATERPALPAEIARVLSRQTYARARFHYRFRLAQAFAAEGRQAAARAVLGELLAEIDERRLADWENPEELAGVVRLHLEVTRRLGEEPGEAAARLLARLDPLAAAEAG